MRNSTRYIPRKRWAEFAKDIKAVYTAVSLDEATTLFESFSNQMGNLPIRRQCLDKELGRRFQIV